MLKMEQEKAEHQSRQPSLGVAKSPHPKSDFCFAALGKPGTSYCRALVGLNH